MNIAVAQSGGPTAAINASLLGVYREAKASDGIDKVYGVRYGVDGLLNGAFVDLDEELSSPERQALLRQTPAAVLGSCRHKLPDPETDPSLCERVFASFAEKEIGALLMIGGNDSMDTALKLSRYGEHKGSPVRIVGVPKTIDGDLARTDHTPGFGSAAKYVASTLSEITRDASVYDLDNVVIAEIMGRHAGWLTAASCLLRVNGETAPHLTYLPEVPFSVHAFLDDVRSLLQQRRTVVVAVSEGIKLDFSDHTDDARHGVLDGFGHVGQLSGVGKALEKVVRREVGCKVRSVELNVMQRCSSLIASETDLKEAETAGREGVKRALEGKSGVMVTLERISNDPYEIAFGCADLSDVANVEKMFPREWINREGNGVKDEAIGFYLPLVQGEPATVTKNGLPAHLKLQSVLTE